MKFITSEQKYTIMTDLSSYFDANRALWNAKTRIHKDSDFYDVSAFKAGKTSLNKIELNLLPDVQGKNLLHLQCHFGQDTISFSRAGAKVTGIDLSDDSIATAKELAAELEVDTRFIRSNVYDISDHLEGEKFDHIFTSYGAICWLPDLDRWAQLIKQHLKPGGQFTLAEFHPAIYMFDWESEKISYNYFNKGVYTEENEGTYTDINSNKKTDIILKEHFWIHSVSEVVTALLTVGLRVTHLQEYDYSPYECFENLTLRKEGEWIWGTHGKAFPHVFSLQCTLD